MKKLNVSTKLTLTTILVLLIGAITTSCKKDIDKKSGDSGDFGNVPRLEVPDPFVGEFTYVTSTGGYVDEYGHYINGVAQGVTLHIEKNGTGTSLYHAETGSYSGAVTTDEIRSQCTYEITKKSDNTANIIIHYVSGKDYHNGEYLHDLDASKIYPNGDAVWNDCQFGTNSQGTYFIVGSGSNTAQFTRK